MTQLIVLSCLALILSTAFVTAGRAWQAVLEPGLQAFSQSFRANSRPYLAARSHRRRQTRWQAVGADEKRMIARRFPHSRPVSVVGTSGDLFATRASYLGFVRGRS